MHKNSPNHKKYIKKLKKKLLKAKLALGLGLALSSCATGKNKPSKELLEHIDMQLKNIVSHNIQEPSSPPQVSTTQAKEKEKEKEKELAVTEKDVKKEFLKIQEARRPKTFTQNVKAFGAWSWQKAIDLVNFSEGKEFIRKIGIYGGGISSMAYYFTYAGVVTTATSAGIAALQATLGLILPGVFMFISILPDLRKHWGEIKEIGAKVKEGFWNFYDHPWESIKSLFKAKEPGEPGFMDKLKEKTNKFKAWAPKNKWALGVTLLKTTLFALSIGLFFTNPVGYAVTSGILAIVGIVNIIKEKGDHRAVIQRGKDWLEAQKAARAAKSKEKAEAKLEQTLQEEEVTGKGSEPSNPTKTESPTNESTKEEEESSEVAKEEEELSEVAKEEEESSESTKKEEESSESTKKEEESEK